MSYLKYGALLLVATLLLVSVISGSPVSMPLLFAALILAKLAFPNARIWSKLFGTEAEQAEAKRRNWKQKLLRTRTLLALALVAIIGGLLMILVLSGGRM